jgi:hypothetical protein
MSERKRIMRKRSDDDVDDKRGENFYEILMT